MAKFEALAAMVRERASQPEYGAAMRAAIAEDAAEFVLDEATGSLAGEERCRRAVQQPLSRARHAVPDSI